MFNSTYKEKIKFEETSVKEEKPELPLNQTVEKVVKIAESSISESASRPSIVPLRPHQEVLDFVNRMNNTESESESSSNCSD